MSIYITTPIFYASGAPHLGHAYSAIIADCSKRYHRLKHSRAFVLTGTDENGQKIERTAAINGATNKAFVDSRSLLFKHLWHALDFEYDAFVRTTDVNHHQLVRQVWQKLASKGDIYLGKYEGLYCVECEQYYTQRQSSDGACPIHGPIHGKKLEKLSEPTYLFKLSQYKDAVVTFYKSNPGFIQPDYFRYQIIEALNSSECHDLSISRVHGQWGISVPGDSQHIIYVWLDALFSYVTALTSAGGTVKDLQNTHHVIGKDILKFHGIYWLCFLLAAELPLPKRLVVHGWWTCDGRKISKSGPAKIISPAELATVITTDGLRLGLLSQKPLEKDGNLSVPELIVNVNSLLANNFGNLVKRLVTIAYNNFTGEISWQDTTKLSCQSELLIREVNEAIQSVDRAYQFYEFSEVCNIIGGCLSAANAYFHEREPWKKRVNADSEDHHVKETLCVVGAVLKVIVVLLKPITPKTSALALSQLNDEQNGDTWPVECKVQALRVNKPISVFERLKI
ncbi:MAG: methionine--tRNA ligase [Pseudomonadales bacterium]|nr:methionine--tRNA ligase [Pseudomonadales bacterium]